MEAANEGIEVMNIVRQRLSSAPNVATMAKKILIEAFGVYFFWA